MSAKPINNLNVADVIDVIEVMAPPILAEDWDNCGLQVGSRKWPVRKIRVALDPLLDVVQAAAAQQVDLLITHHPLLFSALRTVDLETAVGRVIEAALASQMAIYSAHTNLDSASGGLNQMFADIIGLDELVPMVPAGPVSDQTDSDTAAGMGRLGRLETQMSLEVLAKLVKRRFNLKAVKIVGDPQMSVQRVAVCSGAGSSLLDVFLSSEADVYLTGDLRYHDARRVEDHGRALIDVGHFASEHIFIDKLVDQLRQYAHRKGWTVEIEPCRIENDPFKLIS